MKRSLVGLCAALTLAALPVAALSAQSAAASAAAPPPSATPMGWLAVTGWYKDLKVQQAYTKATGEVLRQYGYQGAIVGTPGVNLTVLEGGWAPRFLLLIKFPNERRVTDFWWSDAYRTARQIRVEQANLDVVETPGLPGATPTANPGAAYLVFFMHLTDNKSFLADYAPFAPAVVASHGGKFLIRTGRENLRSLEGAWPNQGLVLVEFPNLEALRGFWNSAEYRRLSEVRKATGDWSVVEIAPLKR